MKKRIGFVSNSSSSSFVVIAKNKKEEIPVPIVFNNRLTIPRNNDGETEFDGGGMYSDFDSKLNFLVLQALYADNVDYLNLIYQVLRLKFKNIDIELNLRRDYIDFEEDDSLEEDEKLHFGSIDHQSIGAEFLNFFEGTEEERKKNNVSKYFSIEERMYNFLFMRDSYLYINRDCTGIDDLVEEIDKEKYWIFTYY